MGFTYSDGTFQPLIIPAPDQAPMVTIIPLKAEIKNSLIKTGVEKMNNI